jgi:hypothetical protein
VLVLRETGGGKHVANEADDEPTRRLRQRRAALVQPEPSAELGESLSWVCASVETS